MRNKVNPMNSTKKNILNYYPIGISMEFPTFCLKFNCAVHAIAASDGCVVPAEAGIQSNRYKATHLCIKKKIFHLTCLVVVMKNKDWIPASAGTTHYAIHRYFRNNKLVGRAINKI